MRRREFVVLLASGVAGLALPRVCFAQQRQFDYYKGQVPDEAYEDGMSFRWGRHIWIWQYDQIGEAIEDGVIQIVFRIISGLAETKYRTREGDFRIYGTRGWNYRNHEGVDMPLAMFFDGTRALHGWSRTEPFPDIDEAATVASHGCISVDKIVELYNWASKDIPVHVRSQRIGYW